MRDQETSNLTGPGLADFDCTPMLSLSRMVNEDAQVESVFSEPVLSVKGLGASAGGGLRADLRGMAPTLAIQVRGDVSNAFICAACGLAVEGDAYCTEGTVFHPEHYSLAKSVPVNPSTNDVGFDSLEDHHVPRAAARCGGCDEPVQPTMSVHRDGEIWHVACLKTFEGSHRKLLGHLPRPLSVVSSSISLPSLTSSPSRSATGGSLTPDYVSFYSVDNPSAGAARLSLEEFCADVYRSTGAIENPNDSVAVVATLFWHKEPTGVRHEFLLAQVCQLGRNDVWLRLERGAKRNGSALRRMQLASSVSCPADDSVMISSLKETLIRGEKSNVDAKLAFKDTLTLLDLATLLSIFTEECPKYNLLGQNCYYFCSVVTDMLQQRFRAGLEGHIKYKNMSPEIRLRIRQRWIRATSHIVS